VNLNFETGGVEKLEHEDSHEPSMPSFPSFVGDILERESSPPNPPTAPSLSANVNGFPAHKKRVPRASTFKQQRAAKEKRAAAESQASAQNAPLHARSAESELEAEKQSIDEENQKRLESMSEHEIEEERQELLSSLSPALLQKLLGRSNIDQGSNERDLFPPEYALPPATDDSKKEPESKPTSTKKVSFAPGPQHDAPSPEIQPTGPTPHIQPTPATTTNNVQEASDSLHFPTARQTPDLDPNDPAFLKNLHEKYFPNLAYNPSALSWMAPIDPSDKSSPYHPSQTALNATELRFDFKGSLLAPSIARSLPSNRGLHHHSDAPEAAGYTIPELAVLSRSAVPAQRCMAYQTLGRILYRLGQGEYGVEKGKQDTDGPVKMASDPNTEEGESDDDDEQDVGSAMAAGLWSCIDEGRIVDTLTEEANKERGHLTARTFAEEALWNWRRGGGRKRQAV